MDKVWKMPGSDFILTLDSKNEVYVKQGEGGYIVINRDSLGGNDHTGGKQPENAVEMKSGQDGTFVIYGLDSGTYYLKETEAPAGYRLLTETDCVKYKKQGFSKMIENAYVKGDGKTEKGLEKTGDICTDQRIY